MRTCQWFCLRTDNAGQPTREYRSQWWVRALRLIINIDAPWYTVSKKRRHCEDACMYKNITIIHQGQESTSSKSLFCSKWKTGLISEVNTRRSFSFLTSCWMWRLKDLIWQTDRYEYKAPLDAQYCLFIHFCSNTLYILMPDLTGTSEEGEQRKRKWKRDRDTKK